MYITKKVNRECLEVDCEMYPMQPVLSRVNVVGDNPLPSGPPLATIRLSWCELLLDKFCVEWNRAFCIFRNLFSFSCKIPHVLDAS